MVVSTTKIVSHVLEEYNVDVKAGAAIAAVIALIEGLIGKRTISQSKFRKAVDFLVKHYDKHSNIMSSVGLAIGIIYVLDSNNDRKTVRRLQGEVITAFKHYPQNLWDRRLTEIRDRVKELKTRQWTTGALKFAMCISFGCLAYASTAGVFAKTALALGSSACGVATAINSVNYYNLHELMKHLERDGYLN